MRWLRQLYSLKWIPKVKINKFHYLPVKIWKWKTCLECSNNLQTSNKLVTVKEEIIGLTPDHLHDVILSVLSSKTMGSILCRLTKWYFKSRWFNNKARGFPLLWQQQVRTNAYVKWHVRFVIFGTMLFHIATLGWLRSSQTFTNEAPFCFSHYRSSIKMTERERRKRTHKYRQLHKETLSRSQNLNYLPKLITNASTDSRYKFSIADE